MIVELDVTRRIYSPFQGEGGDPVTINDDVLVMFTAVSDCLKFPAADPAASLSVSVPVFQRAYPPASPRVDPEACPVVLLSAVPRVDYPAVFPDRRSIVDLT